MSQHTTPLKRPGARRADLASRPPAQDFPRTRAFNAEDQGPTPPMLSGVIRST
jgi:hypothetical protein